MAYLIKPFFGYSGAISLRPGVDEENPTYPKTVERFDNISSNGRRISYLVGSRNFIEVTFRWQDQTLRTAWETFWDAVKDGNKFVYYDDDSIQFASATDKAGTGVFAGKTTAGTAVAETWVTMESTELNFFEEEIDGYWSVTIRMREYVV